jgi:hypothetical protein
MRKSLTALVAVAVIGLAVVSTSNTAEARWGGGGGWHGGGYGWRGGGYGWRGGWGWGPGPFVAGALVGGAIAAGAYAPYYYGYGPYYPYGPYPYAYGCRRVWNGYYWVRTCY